jgi:hypothetical protein
VEQSPTLLQHKASPGNKPFAAENKLFSAANGLFSAASGRQKNRPKISLYFGGQGLAAENSLFSAAGTLAAENTW